MTATLAESLALLPGRCQHGYHATQRNLCHDCTPTAPPTEAEEWRLFRTALRTAAGRSRDGLIHQTDVRPLITSIPHKHRGLLYRKSRSLGLIELAGKEPSTDVAGRNGDKDQKVYRWLGAA